MLRGKVFFLNSFLEYFWSSFLIGVVSVVYLCCEYYGLLLTERFDYQIFSKFSDINSLTINNSYFNHPPRTIS